MSGVIVTKIKKHVSMINIIIDNISETLCASNVLYLCPGQIKLSKYIRITESKTNLSLNKNPV